MELPGVPERITQWLTERPNGCWSWGRAHRPSGYGSVWWEGQQRTVHHVLYVLLRGAVPEDRVLDHVVCDDKTCANPFHVEPETSLRNMLRSELAPATINAHRATCAHGHNDWTTRPDGRRRCMACDRERAWEAQRKKLGIPLEHPFAMHFNRRGR